MGCPKIVPKGNLSEMVSNWQISIGYEDNQIMTCSICQAAFLAHSFGVCNASLGIILDLWCHACLALLPHNLPTPLCQLIPGCGGGLLRRMMVSCKGFYFPPGFTFMLFTFRASTARPSWAEEQSNNQTPTLSGCKYLKMLTASIVCSWSCSRSHQASWSFPGYATTQLQAVPFDLLSAPVWVQADLSSHRSNLRCESLICFLYFSGAVDSP